MTDPKGDLTGDALKAQRFKMLEDIAKELSDEVVFPTCFDVSLRLRNVLRDPDSSIEQVVDVIRADPLICSRLIRLANSAAQASRGEVRDVGNAVVRLGFKVVRNVALTVAMNQLVRSKDLLPFGEMSKRLWEHSLYSACAAMVIARELSKINPDEAMFAGLIHDMGAFYMLYRAAQYDDLRARPDTVRYLISQWHESIGEALLFALQLPEAIIEATRFHDQPRPPMEEAPRNLSDVVYAANVMATADFEWLDDTAQERVLGEQYMALVPAIEEAYTSFHAEYA